MQIKSPKEYRHARARCSALRTLKSAAYVFLALMIPNFLQLMIPKLTELVMKDSYTLLEIQQLRVAAGVAMLMVVGNYMQRYNQIKRRQVRRAERRKSNEEATVND